jgi:hypothetical protein
MQDVDLLTKHSINFEDDSPGTGGLGLRAQLEQTNNITVIPHFLDHVLDICNIFPCRKRHCSTVSKEIDVDRLNKVQRQNPHDIADSQLEHVIPPMLSTVLYAS